MSALWVWLRYFVSAPATREGLALACLWCLVLGLVGGAVWWMIRRRGRNGRGFPV